MFCISNDRKFWQNSKKQKYGLGFKSINTNYYCFLLNNIMYRQFFLNLK